MLIDGLPLEAPAAPLGDLLLAHVERAEDVAASELAAALPLGVVGESLKTLCAIALLGDVCSHRPVATRRRIRGTRFVAG